MRGPHPVSGRSAETGQPFVQWATPDDYLRRLDGPARHLTVEPEPGSKLTRIIIIGILAALAWLGVLWLVGAM